MDYGLTGRVRIELKEPTFLRKLRQNNTTADPSRHERPINRPRRQRADDEDDGPTYVDEESNDVITKAEYEALIQQNVPTDQVVERSKGDGHDASNANNKRLNEEEADIAAKENFASVGASKKKRKAIAIRNDESDVAIRNTTETSTTGSTSAKRKIKKKVKLSFNDDSAE